MSNEISNDNLILISGITGTGKSASLMSLRNDSGIVYANCEASKKLPFKHKFKEVVVTDPMTIFDIFEEAEEDDSIHTIVIDTVTYLMDMVESQYVLTADNTMKAWSDYAQFFKKLLQESVASSSKNVIMLAHTREILNETEGVLEVKVPIKGALANQGVESYFSCVVSTKKILLKDLKDYANDYLHLTEEDEIVGYKHVFQTRITKKTINERIRSPIGMWEIKETYIDNDIGILLKVLHEYYED